MDYVLIDLERSILSGAVTYWKPHKRGYTVRIEKAGVYDEEQANLLVDGDYNQRTVKVSLDLINAL